jgi:tetratricopeptide (TPR) repeat protein
MAAATLGFQGDARFYRGDFQAAHAAYAEALPTAIRSKEPDAVLIAKANLAKVGVEERHTQEAIGSLRQLVQQADELGLKYTSVECSIFMAQAFLQNRDRARARQELERALLLSDKLGMQPLSARAYYLLATIDRETGNASDARDHYREVLRLLDAMKKDPGAEKILERSDFKTMYDESSRGAQSASN